MSPASRTRAPDPIRSNRTGTGATNTSSYASTPLSQSVQYRAFHYDRLSMHRRTALPGQRPPASLPYLSRSCRNGCAGFIACSGLRSAPRAAGSSRREEHGHLAFACMRTRFHPRFDHRLEVCGTGRHRRVGVRYRAAHHVRAVRRNEHEADRSRAWTLPPRWRSSHPWVATRPACRAIERAGSAAEAAGAPRPLRPARCL